MRTLLLAASLFFRRLFNWDLKTKFLQTLLARPDVYDIPPLESDDHVKCFCLHLSASYGLFNANSKFKVHLDNLPHYVDFIQAPLRVKQFFIIHQGKLVVILSKMF